MTRAPHEASPTAAPSMAPDPPAHAGTVVAVVAGVLCVDGCVLIGQRRGSERHPFQWEFPGGKIETGEDARAALVRELREELGVVASVGDELGHIRHRYEADLVIDLTFVQVEAIDREPINQVFADLRWVSIGELPGVDFLAADSAFVAALVARAVVPRPTALPPLPAPSPDPWKSVDLFLAGMIEQQETKVLALARSLVPDLTAEDLRNPHDFPALVASATFNYEDGILAGLRSARIAARAEQRLGGSR